MGEHQGLLRIIHAGLHLKAGRSKTLDKLMPLNLACPKKETNQKTASF
jgi:hypothetical protein